MVSVRKLLGFVAGLSLIAGAPIANAISLTVGDASYLGSVAPGQPADGPSEDSYINALRLLDAGDEPVLCIDVFPDSKDQTCSRVGSTLAGPFPVAEIVGKNDQLTGPTLNLGGLFQYVLGKYGNAAGTDAQVSYVWYFESGVSEVTLPGQGLSHISWFNGTTQVPEPGTLALLGLGLIGLGAARRKAV